MNWQLSINANESIIERPIPLPDLPLEGGGS